MKITKEMTNDTLTLKLEGRLDTVTAPELDKELDSSMSGVNQMVLDLADLDYISSAGLRVVLKAHKYMSDKGGLKVIHACEMVQEVFSVTGFDEILDIE